MSTSDSDYSIDWLTSDDDAGSPKRSSPKCAEGSPSPVTSSLSFCCGVTRRRADHKDGSRCKVNADSAVTPLTPAAGPVCACPSIYSQQTLSTRCPNGKRTRSAGPCEGPQASSEDEFFSQKCLELQCYIQPLSSILQGLRSGRYSERLSSFQESVAMDRIQRIMGVLQNPNMGGRFVNILLKIEEMLHSWFPHIEMADDGVPARKKKRHHSATSSPPCSQASLSSSHMVSSPVSLYSFTHLKWLHTSPVRSLKTPASPPSPACPLPPGCTQEVTQDNAVSSTTDLYSVPLRQWRGPSSFKIKSPCLQRLLQAKESIIAPRTMGGGVRL